MEKPITSVFNNAPGMNTIYWEHSGQNVDHFQVRRKAPPFTWAYIAHVGQHIDKELQPITDYTYQVCAVSDTGEAECSEEQTVRTMQAEGTGGGLPPAPALTRYEITPMARIRLWWRAPQSYDFYQIRWRFASSDTEHQERKEYEGSEGYYELGTFGSGDVIILSLQGCNSGAFNSSCGLWSQPYTIQVIPPATSAPVDEQPLLTVPTIYSITADGMLRWHRHDGAAQGLGLDSRSAWADYRNVGVGWNAFSHVCSGGDGIIYAVAEDGTLTWYKHGQFRDPQPAPRTGTSGGIGNLEFEEISGRRDIETLQPRVHLGVLDGGQGPRTVAGGWGGFKHVFSSGDGIIYAILPNGILRWFRHAGATTGDATWGPNKDLATGWQAFKQVFSGGQGIIYAITPEGTLRWFKHLGYMDGGSWEAPHHDVGTGWNFTRVFSPGGGIIYAVAQDGRLIWFRHMGFKTGAIAWRGPKHVGRGWRNVTGAFGQLPLEPA